MTRIPEAELDRIKREVSLQELVESKGVELKRHGADLLGLCPFHNDKSPSLVVSPAKNLWHCLGACRTGGSVVDWVMRAEGVSFRQAVELLRAKSPDLRASSPLAKASTMPRHEALIARDAGDDEALGQVAQYYHDTLLRSDEALGYLEKRGLRCEEAIKHFRLGFADRTLGYHLPEKNRRAGSELRGRMQKLGVLRPSGHEHLRGCVVVPIADAYGTVSNLYGRRIRCSQSAEGGEHLYLPGPRRGLFNPGGLCGTRSVILCEALIDALTFWCAGLRKVTSAYGVNGFTDDLFKALQLSGIAQVYIAYDADEAGDSAAASLAVKLQAEGMSCWRVRFPPGHDANSFALASANAAESLVALVDDATWMGREPQSPRGRMPRVAASPNSSATAKERPQEVVAAPDAGPAPVLMPTPAAAATPTPAPLGTPRPPPSPATAPVSTTPSPAKPSSPPPAMTSAPSPPPPPTLARPQRASALETVAEQVSEGEVVFRFGERRWRVRGLLKNNTLESLKVNVQVSLGDAFHVDTLDLYAARHRGAFVSQAAEELALEDSVIKRDMGRVLLRLEDLHEQELLKGSEPAEQVATMTPEEREAALALLRDPRLLDRILEDFDTCGVVGERDNKLVGYLASVSRKLNKPLAVVVQSSSAAGKSALMDAVLAFVRPRTA